MNIGIPYYEDKTRYSNSDIGYFLKYGPKSLKDYKEGGGNRLEGSFQFTVSKCLKYSNHLPIKSPGTFSPPN